MRIGRPPRKPLLAIALTALAGCVDPASSDRSPQRNASAPQSEKAIIDFVLAPRFDVTINVEGALRPNTPIRLTAIVSGLLQTDNAELRISTPEVESAKSSRWDSGFRIQAKTELPSVSKQQLSLARGAVRIVEGSITVPAPGYYRVVASARDLDARLGVQPTTVDAAHATVWLWVSETGGRVTQGFDRGVFPEKAVRQPGPLRYREQGSQSAVSADRIASSPGTRTWEVLYWDDYWNNYEPLVGATVTGTEGPGGGSTTPVFQTTDVDGEFNTECDTEIIYAYDLEVNAENFALVVGPDTVVATFTGAPTGCGDEQILVEHDAEAHIFNQTRISISNSLDFFDDGRSQIWVEIADADWSGYSNDPDRITIDDGHVFILSTPVITAHEFGHALHEGGLGGLPDGISCGAHSFPVYTNLKCAYAEGFAEYHALVTRSDVASPSAFESNSYLLVNPNPDGSNPNDPDGTVIEGAITALFFDLTDAANEAHDAVAFPGSYVAEVMETCQVGDSFDTLHASGIDHLIRCLEKQVDSSINGYFYYRTPVSTTHSESATEPGSWNLNNIRALWKKNLFNQ